MLMSSDERKRLPPQDAIKDMRYAALWAMSSRAVMSRLRDMLMPRYLTRRLMMTRVYIYVSVCWYAAVYFTILRLCHDYTLIISYCLIILPFFADMPVAFTRLILFTPLIFAHYMLITPLPRWVFFFFFFADVCFALPFHITPAIILLIPYRCCFMFSDFTALLLLLSAWFSRLLMRVLCRCHAASLMLVFRRYWLFRLFMPCRFHRLYIMLFCLTWLITPPYSD